MIYTSRKSNNVSLPHKLGIGGTRRQSNTLATQVEPLSSLSLNRQYIPASKTRQIPSLTSSQCQRLPAYIQSPLGQFGIDFGYIYSAPRPLKQPPASLFHGWSYPSMPYIPLSSSTGAACASIDSWHYQFMLENNLPHASKRLSTVELGFEALCLTPPPLQHHSTSLGFCFLCAYLQLHKH